MQTLQINSLTCAQCGKESSLSAKFCTGCGSRLAVQPVYAGFWIRVNAQLIDTAVFFGAALFIFFPLLYCCEFVLGKTYGLLVPGLLFGIIAFGYYPVCESSKWQATVGKHYLGLIVTDIKGNRISFWRAFLRFLLLGLFGRLTFGLANLAVAFTAKKQGLHDLLAKTLVIKKNQNAIRVSEPIKPNSINFEKVEHDRTAALFDKQLPFEERQNKPPKTRFHWLFWWRIDPNEITKQVTEYRSLRFYQSARGISFLCLIFSCCITDRFDYLGPW